MNGATTCKQHKELDSSSQKWAGKAETVPSGTHKSKTPEIIMKNT